MSARHRALTTLVRAVVACLVLLLAPLVAQADEFRPALLEITERDDGWVVVRWMVPVLL
jgi:hypothetical protein